MNSKQCESRIPVLSPAPLRRSGSLRLGGCPPIIEHRSNTNHRPLLNRHRSLQSLNTASSFTEAEGEDDAGSVLSLSSVSGASVCSSASQCDHAHFARNGTTYSGRSRRYVYHCSPHSAETDDYLTPTQRTNRTIRRLRNLLKEAQEELAEKDKEIQRLTKEVVELRLLKADSGGEVEGSVGGGGGDAQPVATSPPTATPRYSASPTQAPSLSDSGHFEDLSSPQTLQLYVGQVRSLEAAMEAARRQHEDEIRELKERHNDKVDSLLQRITDVNDRYYALRPLYEECKEKLHELEKLNEELRNRPCENHVMRISELENTNETLLHNTQVLMDEIGSLNTIKEELNVSKANHDKLIEENMELKNKLEELRRIINNMKENSEGYNTMNGSDLLDGSSQTQESHLCNGFTQDDASDAESTEQTDRISLMEENAELKKQIVYYSEKLKEAEELQNKEKDIYAQIYQKGLQAAKMEDNKGEQDSQNNDSQSSLVPDLLQKLKIKQEELDNLKDKDYVSPYNLLSAKEAVSLWKLARKAMYRRLLESRKERPKHDPEMTLQFLKSAFYYFLTDRENAPGHLSAIESILGFNDTEKSNIEKAFLWR